MSREKIKEMTEILKDYTKKQNIMASVVILEDYAEELYNAGYRKQIKAEWKSGNKNGQYGYYCTNCDACFTGENAEWIAKEHDYCPKCGAKMKGGANDDK